MPPSQPPKILLVHGLLNTRWWLWPWAQHLREAGFEVELFGYNSVWGGPEQARPILRAQLMSRRYEAVIGHSLGGLLAVEAARELPQDCLKCIACHCCVAASHTGLVFSKDAIGQAAYFLRHGIVQTPNMV